MKRDRNRNRDRDLIWGVRKEVEVVVVRRKKGKKKKEKKGIYKKDTYKKGAYYECNEVGQVIGAA